MLALIAAGVLLILCARGVSRIFFTSGVPEFEDPLDGFVLESWIGLLWTAWAMLVLSFFTPLQPIAPVLVLIGAAVGLTRLPRMSGSSFRSASLIAIGVAVAGCGTIALYDSGLYHIQMIRMLREFGTLTGAASLHHRFSFSSSWFALSAALEPGFLAGRMATAANVTIFAISTLHFASALSRVVNEKGGAPAWYLTAAYPIAFYRAMLDTEPISPTANPAVALAIIIAGWLLLRDQQRNSRASMLLLAGAACLKMSALPAGIAVLLWRPKQARLALWLILGSAPMFVANFLASGCPAFPSSVCVPTAHTIAQEKAQEVQIETMNWARFGGFYPRSAGPFDTRWIGRWIRRADKLLLALLVAAVGFLIVRRFVNTAVVMAAAGLAFVLWSAPDFRFMYGFIAVLTGSAAAAWAPRFTFPSALRGPTIFWAAAAMVVWLSYAGIREFVAAGVHRASLPAQFIVPAPLPTVAPAANGWSGFSYARPDGGDQCWNLPFPCTPYPVDPALRLCDPGGGLRKGICRSTAEPSPNR